MISTTPSDEPRWPPVLATVAMIVSRISSASANRSRSARPRMSPGPVMCGRMANGRSSVGLRASAGAAGCAVDGSDPPFVMPFAARCGPVRTRRVYPGRAGPGPARSGGRARAPGAPARSAAPRPRAAPPRRGHREPPRPGAARAAPRPPSSRSQRCWRATPRSYRAIVRSSGCPPASSSATVRSSSARAASNVSSSTGPGRWSRRRSRRDPGQSTRAPPSSGPRSPPPAGPADPEPLTAPPS